MEKVNLDFLFGLLNGPAIFVLEFCMDLCLLSRAYVCPKCGKDMSLRLRPVLTDQFEWICRSRSTPSHHVKRSVRSGSYFEKSKVSIPKILLMSHFIIMRIEHRVIMAELGLSSRTVTDWHSFMREVYEDACLRMNEPIGGADVIVEIVESKFGKRKNRRGKRVDEKWVFGGVERGSNKCFFKIVERRDKVSLLNIIQSFILPGTTIYSDCWKSYKCLRDEGFVQLSVNHSLTFKNPETECHTNAIEGTWSVIKKSLPRSIVRDQFDSYLAEYMWRRAHSDTDDLTRAFLQAAADLYPPRSSDPPPAQALQHQEQPI